ncbi:Crp/Fnr family transcriptional regulator [Bacillus massiliigorillae]|uniref:Crp/Fnr family transcriptional regulator n=1 Tax=Bacillus massiliigorillae TaxID=1243664 RepID=UPI0003A17347|nr:Crp/Fnr family transcriptional regulator [Bacillus massiliigorillae]
MSIQQVITYMEENKTLYNLLKHCPYEILKQWTVEQFESGSTFYTQGEVYNHFSLIVDGVANIYAVAENGKKYVQSTYYTGDMIGEIEIFNQVPYMSSVEAQTDITIITLQRDAFLSWLQLDQNFNQHFIRKSIELSYIITKKDEDYKLYSLHDLICKHLLEKIPTGKKQANGIAITIDKHQLSERLAVTQRSINRVLSTLKEKQIIDFKNQIIIVLDTKRLQKE